MKVSIGKPPEKIGQKQKIKVEIHDHDTWNMDYTLAHIVSPMLKHLRQNTHGGVNVDLEDVPADLRPEGPYEVGDLDEHYFDRWYWVLDEMIFAFESKTDESFEDQFFTEGGYNAAAHEKQQQRIDNGFRLFGKYYESLWR